MILLWARSVRWFSKSRGGGWGAGARAGGGETKGGEGGEEGHVPPCDCVLSRMSFSPKRSDTRSRNTVG